MGKVFKPEDLTKRKWIINEAVQDLSLGVRELTKNILESWMGKESKDRLLVLLGDKETERLLKKDKLQS